jgi:hypothetical protein
MMSYKAEFGRRKAECKRAASPSSRRAISTAVVLSLVAVTMATSYALLRTQAYTVRVQQNTNRQGLARQDAMVGISTAMRAIEQSSWSGVGTTLSGSLGSQDSYSVTFTAGDDSLTSASSNYSDYPYRVTLVSTGTSSDSGNSSSTATHKIRAVVRLVPRQLASTPSNWSTMQNYTLYQLASQNVTLDAPCQVAGPVYLQGAVFLGDDYNWSSSTRQKYCTGLNSMRTNGYSDYRWLTGPVSWPSSLSSSNSQDIVQNQFGLTTTIISVASSVSVPLPTTLSTYRLYPGGPSYNVGTVPSSCSNTTLAPDPVTNPLGIFFSNSSVSIGNNVTVTGTLISGGDVTITGSNVVFSPFILKSLSGTTTPIRLPTVVAQNKFYCGSNAQVAVTGVVLAGTQFQVAAGSQNNAVSVQGRVITGAFTVNARSEWLILQTLWTTIQSLWNAQKNSGIAYFPAYAGVWGLNYIPVITVKPDATVITNQWQDLTSGPIYIINASDGGLRWELADWRDLR